MFPRSSNEDVDLLQSELIVIQQRMNDVAMEKEIELERLRIVLRENEQFCRRLNPIERTFEQVNRFVSIAVRLNSSDRISSCMMN